MSQPRHHPEAETLLAYVAGTLRAGFDLAVAAHLRGCARCRAEAGRLERLGGALLDEIAPAALAEGASAAMMARLDAAPPADPAPRGIDALFATARRRWVAPRVWIAKLDTPHAPGDSIFLLGAGRGARTAPHRHRGRELTQVLQGALRDGDTIYRAGDMAEHDAAQDHFPQVHGDAFCLCLFAIEGRLAARTLPGRIAFGLAGV